MLMVIGADLHLELALSTFTVDTPRPDYPNLGTHTYQSVFWNTCQIPKFLAVLEISQNNTTGHQRLTKLLTLECIKPLVSSKLIVSRLLAGYKSLVQICSFSEATDLIHQPPWNDRPILPAVQIAFRRHAIS